MHNSDVKLRGAGVGGSFKALNVRMQEGTNQNDINGCLSDEDGELFDDSESATTVHKQVKQTHQIP